MMFDLGFLSDISGIVTTVIACAAGAVLWMNRQRLGLGEVQVATNAERDRVIKLQEQRITLLVQKIDEAEQKVDDLTKKIEWLEWENERLRDRHCSDRTPPSD